MERPVVTLAAFWVLCVAVGVGVGVGFIIEGFGAGTGTGDLVGVLGVVALLAEDWVAPHEVHVPGSKGASSGIGPFESL